MIYNPWYLHLLLGTGEDSQGSNLQSY